MKKHFILFVIIGLALLVLPLMGNADSVIVDGGDCGENLTWTIDENGLLSITGFGDMVDCFGGPPWVSYLGQISSVMIDDGVLSIGSYAFQGCSNLMEVTIGNSVYKIGQNAFNYCEKLSSITIPDNLAIVGSGAFHACTNLKTVYVSSIQNWLGISFNSETSNPCCNNADLYINNVLASDITISDTCTSINEYAFYSCHSLTNISICDSVRSIGNSAFCRCDQLPTIIIPNSVSFIGSWAFSNCTNLTNITLPNALTSIGHGTFYECTSLSSIIIPENVTEIWDYAFANCTHLESVFVPDGLTFMLTYTSNTNIQRHVFDNCNALIYANLDSNGAKTVSKAGYSFRVPNTKFNLKYLFASDSSISGLEILKVDKDLVSITIPENTTSIGFCAFYECTSLSSIVIPDGVTTIGQRAFYRCSSLSSIFIPDSVTRVCFLNQNHA